MNEMKKNVAAAIMEVRSGKRVRIPLKRFVSQAQRNNV